MCFGLDTVPMDRKVIKYSVHPTMQLARGVSSANCLFTKQCDTPFDSKFCDRFFFLNLFMVSKRHLTVIFWSGQHSWSWHADRSLCVHEMENLDL